MTFIFAIFSFFFFIVGLEPPAERFLPNPHDGGMQENCPHHTNGYTHTHIHRVMPVVRDPSQRDVESHQQQTELDVRPGYLAGSEYSLHLSIKPHTETFIF